MVGSMVPWIKKVVRSIDFQEARQLVETLLQGRDSAENERILSSWIQEKSPDIKEKVLSA
jgi:phosphoenolpyruvate-protein kinase (PTS system EI component)